MLKILHFCGDMSEQTLCRNSQQVKHHALKPLLPARPLHQPSASFQLRIRDKHSHLCWPGSEIKGGHSGEKLKGEKLSVKCDHN